MSIFIAIAILLFSSHSETTLPTIEINSVSMDISTVMRVECSKFDQSFSAKKMKRKKILKQREVDIFLSELKKLQIMKDREETDTRAKIIIRYKDHTDTICADRFSIYHYGTCYTLTERLKKIIW